VKHLRRHLSAHKPETGITPVSGFLRKTPEESDDAQRPIESPIKPPSSARFCSSFHHCSPLSARFCSSLHLREALFAPQGGPLCPQGGYTHSREATRTVGRLHAQGGIYWAIRTGRYILGCTHIGCILGCTHIGCILGMTHREVYTRHDAQGGIYPGMTLTEVYWA